MNFKFTQAGAGHSLVYRPDVDGLRALAVLPVLFYHAKLGFPGGFVGVDIFFVISGFLITALILRELENNNGEFSLIAFWERRIRRILPALAVVVLMTTVAGWFLYLPDDFEVLGKSLMAQAALVPNVFFYLQRSSYFDQGTETFSLLHTWSLAVEEQFYLFFPLLLMLLWRWKKIPYIYILSAIGIASFFISIYGSYKHPVATFYLLPTRAWELFIGALLAIFQQRLSFGLIVRESAGWLGLTLICYSLIFYNSTTIFPGLAAFPPCFGAALIIFSSGSKLSTVGRILAFKPIVFIGLISYSLYLWHWPLLVFTRYLMPHEPEVLARVGVLVVSVILAILSWRFVETPFRKRQIFDKRPHILAFGVICMGSMLAVGYSIPYLKGFPSRFSEQALTFASYKNHTSHMNNVSLERVKKGELDEIGSKSRDHQVTVLIWGDSHAMSLVSAVNALCERYSKRGLQATYAATAPVAGYVSKSQYSLGVDSPAYADAVMRVISEKQVKSVVLAGYWSYYSGSEQFKSQFVATVKMIMDLGAKVYVVKDYPNPGFVVPRIVAVNAHLGWDLERLGTSPPCHDLRNRGFDETFDQISKLGATVLDPAPLFLNSKGLYGVVASGHVLYHDSHHLTLEGAGRLMPLFEPIFKTP